MREMCELNGDTFFALVVYSTLQHYEHPLWGPLSSG